MKVYLYDGTFEGLLACLSVLLQKKIFPQDIVWKDVYKPGLFDETVTIPSQEAEARGWAEWVKRHVPSEVLRKIFYTYLSDTPQKELKIFRFLQFALAKGDKVRFHLSDDRVMDVQKAFEKVRREAGRLLGLVRFKELASGIHYAQIAPDHHVLPLIAGHFSRRLSEIPWIIHDVSRQKAVIYDKHHWRMVDVEGNPFDKFSSEEYFYQNLWRMYFRTIAIESRTNPKLQRQCLPQRYWKFLVEMEGCS